VGGEFSITAISGDSGPPIFPLEIDEHDQLGAKDTKWSSGFACLF
jgi:hypothetical protein